MIGLAPELTCRVTADESLDPTTGSPSGPRQYWRVSAATLDGPRITASLAGAGCDWMRVGPDGFWRPDVRLQFRTDDGAIVLMHYTGLIEQTDAFTAAAGADTSTDWSDQYIRLAVDFDTGADRYRWLTTGLYVAAGRLLGTGHLEYAVHRVT
jgi:Protein of unknown function (DUF3237)